MRRSKALILSSMLLILSPLAHGQYQVGDVVSEEDRNKVLSYCANAITPNTLDDLLSPPVRVLWINFFASW